MNSQKLCTKQKIIAAAKILFVADGYNGTSIRKIAKASNVQTSLIYHYFQNKTCLWKHVKESFIVQNDTFSFSSIMEASSFEDFITELVSIRFNFFKQNHDMLRMFDWQRLEGQGEKLIGITNSKNPGTWENLERKIYQFQTEGVVNRDLSTRHILFMLSGAIFGPFLRTGFSELPSIEEEVKYIDMLTKSLISAFKA
jgi:AcrR family transcriptional regulator